MFPKATRKPPSSTETPPKRFSSNPIDEWISFADALKNQHRKVSPTQPENLQRIIPTNEDFKFSNQDYLHCKRIFNRWVELIPIMTNSKTATAKVKK
ncbi:hypothetical protein CDAR_431891 [Caerostris darwini]|uniref:Uncharacterized protein n=1 Tax=Caerostris darwini TaxID=1538125 RepID=A0AAV4UK28_9ARAC|nr:hypothetical protein CDAR_431891 [Caerostris darwini]